MAEPHIIVARSTTGVYISFNGQEFKMSPDLARDTGEALFKAGCDVPEQEVVT